MVIYGPPESYKSWLGIEMGFCLAMGKPWLEYKTNQCRVMILQAEQVESLYAERVEDYTTARGISQVNVEDRLVFFNDTDILLDAHRGYSTLEDAVIQHRPHVLIVDCLYRVVESESDPQSMGRFMHNLTVLRDRYNLAVVLIHHPRKQGREDGTDDKGLEEMSGVGTFGRWLDSVCKVSHMRKESARGLLRVEWQKQKNVRTALKPLTVQVTQQLDIKVVH